MAGLLDFVFGKGPLKKAAGATEAAPKVTTPAGIDMAAEAKKNAMQKVGAGVKNYGKAKIEERRKKNRESLPGRLASQFMEQ